MQVSDIQMVLAACGWYGDAIDGDAGPKTWAAVAQAEAVWGAQYTESPAGWPEKRRLVAAAQAALTQLKQQPGSIDGWSGPNTLEALTSWRSRRAGVSARVARVPIAGARSHAAQAAYPKQNRMSGFYGKAGGARCTAGKVDLAYPMTLAWGEPPAVIRRFSCHEKLAVPLTAVFREALAHYGQTEITRLSLDIFGGCYNYRKKREGTTLSTHAYGAAVDLNPAGNRLRWGADRAQFAKPEYEPFWAIVMAHGGVPAGYAWGKDWMHFQFARL